MGFVGTLPRSQAHHFCPSSPQEGLYFAAVSRPAAARQRGSLWCQTPGSPELQRSSGAKRSPGKAARQKKRGVQGGGQALAGLLLSASRRQMHTINERT